MIINIGWCKIDKVLKKYIISIQAFLEFFAVQIFYNFYSILDHNFQQNLYIFGTEEWIVYWNTEKKEINKFP